MNAHQALRVRTLHAPAHFTATRFPNTASCFSRPVIYVVFFAAIGFLACIGLGALSVLPNDNFLLGAVPFMLGFGLVEAHLWRSLHICQ